MTQRRVLLIVMDGCGIGVAPSTASPFTPEGATLPNVARAAGPLRLPAMERLGLGCVAPIAGVSCGADIIGSYGSVRIASAGKDSVTGHWEMAGILTPQGFPTYPNGFPAGVIQAFEQAIGRRSLGNVAASGTEIIARLGAEHIRTGFPILYTSADSVFQIAAHEDVVPLDVLYRMCETARALLVEPNNVQRVIARPFIGSAALGFQRTGHRRDFPLPAPVPNLIETLARAGIGTHAIGVVAELFPGAPLQHAERTQSNVEHLAAIQRALTSTSAPFVFANCEDFDMLYGHRNDPQGFARSLEAFDAALVKIVDTLGAGDLLLITADHGNDPTTESTDHSREDVPILAYSPSVMRSGDTGLHLTLADIAATVAAWLGVEWGGAGSPLEIGAS